jgi:HlyD family secretion protein
MDVKTTDSAATDTAQAQGIGVPPGTNLPVPVPPPQATPRRRPWLAAALLALVLLSAAGGSAYWWTLHQNGLPPGFASGNGRIEADEIDIATKFAGRVAEVLADEGDLVKAGQVVARMDARDLESAQRKAEAQALQAQEALDEASANVAQQITQVTLAKQQLERTRPLLPKGYATKEEFDRRQQQVDGAIAALNAAQARVAQSEHALEAARQEIERNRIDIADNTLIAPRDGRIQYRLANIGEVLGAGGKVFTLLDLTYVYMDVFLPTADAGRAMIGADARIVLDAAPTAPIPAKVTFVASEAQFTPKTVETKSERDKLMFRVKVRVDLDYLRGHAAEMRAGLPGVTYVKFDAQAAWPQFLQSKTGG